MLVLTRRSGESIVIGGNIQVTVLSVKGDRVRLGIVAPQSVSVDRQEVYDRRCFAKPDGVSSSAPVSTPVVCQSLVK
jgi:carbon storage regulator